MILVLAGYLLVATATLAVVFLPGFRSAVVVGWRSGTRKATGQVLEIYRACRRETVAAKQRGRWAAGSLIGWVRQYFRPLTAGAALLVLTPLLAVSWRYWNALETFDHTELHVQDERIAALLTGERLVPPAPLPPEVFSTREVELVRPMVRYASRNWDLLDPMFAQRLLMVYRIMLEQHGYEMVLIEGYRSPQRQDQLAALGGHVTQAGAYRSYHQFGLAADSAFLRHGKLVISEQDSWAMRGYQLYGQVAASLGFTWGGGWKSIKDLRHVELRRPGVMRQAKGDAPSAAAYVY